MSTRDVTSVREDFPKRDIFGNMAIGANSDTDFRYELARVIGSATLSKAIKQRELLKWLVEQTIARNRHAFSQYGIATGALGYASDYDATSDSRVRIVVHRLRQKLAEYYQTEGRLNRLHITIEEGQYEPRLAPLEDVVPSKPARPSSSVSPDKPAVLVLPFLPIGFRDDKCFCVGLTLNLMRALAASGQARVVPWTTAHWLAGKTGDKREYYRRTGADVILEALVQRTSDSRWSITVQWVDGPTGLFDTFYEVRGAVGDALLLANDLASQLAHHLRITYDERTRLQLAMRYSSDPAAVTFYLKARQNALNFTPPGVRKVFDLLGHALKRDPHFAAAYALLAEVHMGVGDSGMAPATQHAPFAREAAKRALGLAPELGDALAARGAIELTHDWDLPRAEETLKLACRDLLADGAPHWPPILDLSRGKSEEGAIKFEEWARLDPGSGAKAGVASEMWYYARQFDLAIQWGLRALELDSQNLRAGSIVAASYMEAGRRDDSLRIARSMYDIAPDICETNLVLVTLLAQAGQIGDALQAFRTWERKKGDRYQPPLLLAIAYCRLGETSLALNAMHQVIESRETACLFARSAPYLAPLHGRPEFERMLTSAGVPGCNSATD